MAAIETFTSGLSKITFYEDCVEKSPRLDVGSRIAEAIFNIQCEAGILRGLKHENVVRIINFNPEKTVLSLELLKGHDIYRCIESKVPLETQKIAKQLLSAVSYVHGEEVVHGDITIANVRYIQEEGGRVVLFDFGASGKKGEINRWGPSTAFRSPEQLFKNPLCYASDVWSAAVVIELVRTQQLFLYVHLPTMHEKYRGNAVPREVHLRALEAKIGKKHPWRLLRRLVQAAPENHTPLFMSVINKYTRLIDQVFYEEYQGGVIDFSDGLGTLLKKMLALDFLERISAKDALKDPYFTGA